MILTACEYLKNKDALQFLKLCYFSDKRIIMLLLYLFIIIILILT